MQRHFLVQQLGTRLEQPAQLRQHRLAEVGLLEAVVAAHLGLVGAEALEGRRGWDLRVHGWHYLCLALLYLPFPSSG